MLTNAAGGVNPAATRAGTLMVIRDHLNLTGKTPLLGAERRLAGAAVSRTSPTCGSPALRSQLLAAGALEGIDLEEGVYAGLLGPSYETPAEVRMLGILGADAVGMSTVMEAIALRWAGMQVCGVSLVTNPGAGISDHRCPTKRCSGRERGRSRCPRARHARGSPKGLIVEPAVRPSGAPPPERSSTGVCRPRSRLLTPRSPARPSFAPTGHLGPTVASAGFPIDQRSLG